MNRQFIHTVKLNIYRSHDSSPSPPKRVQVKNRLKVPRAKLIKKVPSHKNKKKNKGKMGKLSISQMKYFPSQRINLKSKKSKFEKIMKDSQDPIDQSSKIIDKKMNEVPNLDNSEISQLSKSNITSTFQFNLGKQKSLASPIKNNLTNNLFFPKSPDSMAQNKNSNDLNIFKAE